MTSTPDFGALLRAEELEELEQFLMSPAVAEDTMTLDELDGYLTALAIGPTVLPLGKWFAGIWGSTPHGMPDFDSDKEMQHIINLIFRRINGIIDTLENNPDSHEPLFLQIETEGESEILIGKSWSMGFMKAIGLYKRDWEPLFENPDGMRALNPIYLMGTEQLTDAQEAQIETLEQCIELSNRIPDSITWIYRFWLPQRQAAMKRAEVAEANVGKHKAGRNDPCPCGSGKKFKKCCGA